MFVVASGGDASRYRMLNLRAFVVMTFWNFECVPGCDYDYVIHVPFYMRTCVVVMWWIWLHCRCVFGKNPENLSCYIYLVSFFLFVSKVFFGFIFSFLSVSANIFDWKGNGHLLVRPHTIDNIYTKGILISLPTMSLSIIHTTLPFCSVISFNHTNSRNLLQIVNFL